MLVAAFSAILFLVALLSRSFVLWMMARGYTGRNRKILGGYDGCVGLLPADSFAEHSSRLAQLGLE